MTKKAEHSSLNSIDYEQMRLVNEAYERKIEAQIEMPHEITLKEGEYVPVYVPNINIKKQKEALKSLHMENVHSSFTESLVGHISYKDVKRNIYYRPCQLKSDFNLVIGLVNKKDFEHYPLETFQYFLQNWPDLCILAFTKCHSPVGVIIGQRNGSSHGYIAYIYVQEGERRKQVGRLLVKVLLNRMYLIGIREVVTEIEVSDDCSLLNFFTFMGFMKEGLLKGYYVDGHDAFKMKMFIHPFSLDEDRYKNEIHSNVFTINK